MRDVGLMVMVIGGVEIHVGEARVSERALAQGGKLVVEIAANTRDLVLDTPVSEPRALTRSPTCVVTVFGRWPWRQVVRVSVCSPNSAPIWTVALAPIS